MHTVSLRSAGMWVGVFALAATLCAAQAGSPAQKPREARQQPVFRTEANFVRVDVYPLRDRRPVLGLEAKDFEVLEDGVPQKIEAFEHIVITPAGPQPTRNEPSTQAESLRSAANPRARVFVIFLDTPNVSVDGAHAINEPLIRLIDRILGPDDLVAVMTPAMAASQIVLARKTQVIEESLRRNWAWGTRFSFQTDQRERAYEACYPPTEDEARAGLTRSVLASEMIRRKRERATLESLQDLVRYLHDVREERKAILTVTEGWMLYRENRQMMALRKDSSGWQEQVPGNEPIVVGPTGKLTTKDPRNAPNETLNKTECDTDRMRLSMMDNDQFFREIMDEANRGNASFYPIDPRGLAPFDTPVGPREESLPILADQASLRTRHEAMRTLAVNTDGLAIIENNDLDVSLKRIADDLTSYYLLGYYSTNAKLDGKFRSLKVRVTQPGVEVRARRGYRAANLEEVTAARRAAEAPAASTASAALNSAIGGLSRIRPDARFRINAVALSAADATTVWIAGETLSIAGGTQDVASGSTADIEVRAGTASQTATVSLQPGQKTFLTTVKLASSAKGPVDVRARLKTEGGVVPVTDAVQTAIGPDAMQPLLFRRGPSTGNRLMPAADFRFTRGERMRIEIPVTEGVTAGTGRLLDRTGQPLQIPVTVSERTDDPTGQRWVTADLALASLGAGDYVVEVTTARASSELKVLTGIRVTR